jgi:hypothetical protein
MLKSLTNSIICLGKGYPDTLYRKTDIRYFLQILVKSIRTAGEGAIQKKNR